MTLLTVGIPLGGAYFILKYVLDRINGIATNQIANVNQIAANQIANVNERVEQLVADVMNLVDQKINQLNAIRAAAIPEAFAQLREGLGAAENEAIAGFGMRYVNDLIDTAIPNAMEAALGPTFRNGIPSFELGQDRGRWCTIQAKLKDLIDNRIKGPGGITLTHNLPNECMPEYNALLNMRKEQIIGAQGQRIRRLCPCTGAYKGGECYIDFLKGDRRCAEQFRPYVDVGFNSTSRKCGRAHYDVEEKNCNDPANP